MVPIRANSDRHRFLPAPARDQSPYLSGRSNQHDLSISGEGSDDVRILLIAPPGAGKGTQGALLADHLGVPHIAAGDLLRAQLRLGTSLGKQVRAVIARGELVPDQLMLALIFDALEKARSSGGFVLDGFPRTRAQAVAARKVARRRDLLAHLAIHLPVDDGEVVRRLLSRGQGRSDDTEIVIRRRLALYHEVSGPLIDFYRRRGLLVDVDGMRPVADVTAAVFAAVGAARAQSA
jgi:adenylate kinase